MNLESVCKKLMKDVDIAKTHDTSGEIFHYENIEKVVKACLIMKEALEESLRTSRAAIGDFQFQETKKNQTKTMLQNLDDQLTSTLEQVERLMGE